MLPLWRFRVCESKILKHRSFTGTHVKIKQPNTWTITSFHLNTFLWNLQPRKGLSVKKGTANKSKVSIEKYLNQFLLQVHPDFFHQQPDLQKTNQESLQKLNSLLEVVRSADGLEKLPKRMDLTFWLKPAGERIRFDSVQVSIDLQMKRQDSNTFLTASGVRMMLEEKLEDGLFGLFMDAGIQLPYSLTEEIKERRKNRTEEEFKTENLHSAVLKELKRVLNFEVKDAEWLMKEKTGKKMQPPKPTKLPGSSKFTDFHNFTDRQVKMIFFDNDVNQESRDKIYSQLLAMSPGMNLKFGHLWHSFPMLFKNNLNSISFDRKSGFIMIPINFTQKSLFEYIDHNFETLKNLKNAVRDHIDWQIKLKKDLIDALKIEDIFFPQTLKPEVTVETLRRLLDLDLLAKLGRKDWSEIRLFIGKNYNIYFEESGVQIPFDFKKEELLSFLERIDMNALRIQNNTSDKHKKILFRYMSMITKRLGVKKFAVDPSFYKLSKVEQISILKQMFEDSKLFMKVNMSSVTFFIGADGYNYDPIHQVISAPFMFEIQDCVEFLKSWRDKYRQVQEKVVSKSKFEAIRKITYLEDLD